MSNEKVMMLSTSDKKTNIKMLTDDLPVYRARIGISQEELCVILGISRQTYSAVETGRRQMSWHTFLTLLLYFSYNAKTKAMLEDSGIISGKLVELLNYTRR